MFSLAKIPFLKTHFTGFLSFLKFDEKMYLFSTYTNAKVKKLSYKNGNISVLIEDRKYILSIEGSYDKSGVLKAPKNGMMERKISESITSQLTVTLKSKDGKILFKDIGQRAGLEIVKDEKKSQI